MTSGGYSQVNVTSKLFSTFENVPHVVQKNMVDLSRLSQLAHGGFSELASSTNWRIS